MSGEVTLKINVGKRFGFSYEDKDWYTEQYSEFVLTSEEIRDLYRQLNALIEREQDCND